MCIMNAFWDTFFGLFGYIAAICCGIIILALFFTILNFIKGTIRGVRILKLEGFIKEGKLVNIHLRNNKTVSGVRFVGFTDASGKNAIPYQLSSMLLLETPNGKRVFLRTDHVNMIEEIENTI